MVIKNYFAAANGYTGFRSYFSDVFNSNDYEHIFVIKGGPGTGKSTLMKKIAKKATEQKIDHDKIFCSSDPSSLDGVIIHSERGKFAVIDGTAPHERDAVIPGAIDTIINLGDSFDEKKLKEYRAEIVALNERKKAAYKSAYDTLKAAGAISERINNLIKSSFSYRKANLLVDDLLAGHKAKKLYSSIMLTRAFCKLGLYKTDSFSNYKEKYTVFGTHGEDIMFLNILEEKSRQFNVCKSHSPLFHGDCDAIGIGETAYISTSNENKTSLDAREFIDEKYSKEEINCLESIHENLLNLSKKHFNDASIYHFDLEKIYSSAVFFEKNEQMLKKILSAIF